MDVTVVNLLQGATVAEKVTTPGYALTYAYKKKISGAEEDCRRPGIAFLLIAAKSLGAGTRWQRWS